MKLLRLVIGVPFIVIGLVLLLCSVGLWLGEKDAKAGAVVMDVIGLALIWVGRKFIGTRKPDDWRDDPASEKQKSFARDLGIKFHPGIKKGELSDLISEETGN